MRAQTGWDLRVASRVEETLEPSADELAWIRAADPGGFWTQPRDERVEIRLEELKAPADSGV